MKKITFYGSARFSKDSVFYKDAYELALFLAKSGYEIYTGGGGGIMQAANEAAQRVGVKSVGINIKLPFEQKINPFCSESVEFSDISLRKKALMQNKIAIVCPGGFGTLDELFELLTLKQTKLDDFVVILYGEKFFRPLVDFFENVLLKTAAIDENSMKLFYLASTPQDVAKILQGEKNESN